MWRRSRSGSASLANSPSHCSSISIASASRAVSARVGSCYDALRFLSLLSSSSGFNPSLKPLIASPMPRPSPGSRFAPKMTMIIARMTSSSGRPRRPMVRLLEAAIVPLFLSATGAVGIARPYAQFTSGVNLVEVYASVTDSTGEPVAGLRASDFKVLEDGVTQTISTFAGGEFPLAVAVGIDRSFSMGGKGDRLAVAKSASRAFLSALRPADRVMVVAIGSEILTVAPLSADRTTALAAIDRLDAWGTTPLYDAALGAIDAIQPAGGRRALVLLSDGADRYSDTRATDLVERARNRDVLVYPVAVGPARPPLFAELASATGGRSFFGQDSAALNRAMAAIARELRFQYLLGYVPTRERAGDASWRAIQVTVANPQLRVRAREGYRSR